MMELPEVLSVSKQAEKVLKGKVIQEVFTPTNPHKFAFFNDTPEAYKAMLTGKKILSSDGVGMYVDLHLQDDVHISIGDGINMKYGEESDKIPEKYQLLLTFKDNSFLVFTIGMYGAIFVYKGKLGNKYHTMSLEKISPLNDAFDEKYFLGLFENERETLSAKALLATEQRIPGVGNGVTQDILFNARINPKRKIGTLSEKDKKAIFRSLKDTLKKMTEEGGRNTEKDLSGEKGGYQTILSSKTYKEPCPVCGGAIVKESFMGGTVYYCPNCQPL